MAQWRSGRESGDRQLTVTLPEAQASFEEGSVMHYTKGFDWTFLFMAGKCRDLKENLKVLGKMSKQNSP